MIILIYKINFQKFPLQFRNHDHGNFFGIPFENPRFDGELIF